MDDNVALWRSQISHVGCRAATVKRRSPHRCGLLYFISLFLLVCKPLNTSSRSSFLFHWRVFRRRFHVPDKHVALIAANGAPASRTEEPSETQCHRCHRRGAAITRLSVHKIAWADVYLAEKHVCSFVIKVAPTCGGENSSLHAGSSAAVQGNSWRCTCSTAPLKSS